MVVDFQGVMNIPYTCQLLEAVFPEMMPLKLESSHFKALKKKVTAPWVQRRSRLEEPSWFHLGFGDFDAFIFGNIPPMYASI